MKSGSISTVQQRIVLVVLLSSVLGCRASRPGETGRPTPVLRAVYCESVIDLDGRLDEAAWGAAPAYPLGGSLDQPHIETFEGGRVRACWDREYLYIAFEFEDSDVVAESAQGERHHYRFGDTAEFFLKPADAPCYWEMHATPRGYRATYFYPSFGRFGLPSNFNERSGLRVAASVDGTIGDDSDRDHGWTVELAIPVSDVAGRVDVPWGAGTAWAVLVGRYNYGRYNAVCELTSYPALPATDFHHHAWYAVLSLELPGAGRDD